MIYLDEDEISFLLRLNNNLFHASQFSSIVSKGMVYSSTDVIGADTDSMGTEGITSRWNIFCSTSFLASNMFHLITGHSFIEV